MSEPDRHSEALLGIHLAQSGRQSKGSPPSDEELVLLINGELDDSRRAEVLSHLAARPERYRQWLNLAELDAGAQPAKTPMLQVLTQGLNNWLIDWRYAAGGLASVVAAVLLVSQMQQPPEHTPAEFAATQEPQIAADYSFDDLTEEAPAPPRQEKSALQREREEARRSQSLQGAAKRMATPIARRCAPLSHPASAELGRLCALTLSNGDNKLQWQASGSDAHRPLGELPEKVLQIKASESGQWLALQSARMIMVQKTENLFTENSQRAQLPFNAGTASMRWEGEALIISVLQALGDSDDDLKYQYQPTTGELIQSE